MCIGFDRGRATQKRDLFRPRAWNRKDIELYLSEKRADWNAPKYLTPSLLISFLFENESHGLGNQLEGIRTENKACDRQSVRPAITCISDLGSIEKGPRWVICPVSRLERSRWRDGLRVVVSGESYAGLG
jgi:hypothetical protein